MKHKLGYLYTSLMTLYFFVSGGSVLFDVPGKLDRIDLQAINSDGEIAFILIYSGLMVGIAVAGLIMIWMSKSWVYSALLFTVIIGSFIMFRLIGSLMVGVLSSTQISFLAFEVVEFLVGIILLKKAR